MKLKDAAIAWRDGSHQIRLDDKNKIDLLEEMRKIAFPNDVDVRTLHVSDFYCSNDRKNWMRFNANLPIIKISEITQDDDFQWGDEVEVSENGVTWFPRHFVCMASNGRYITEARDYNCTSGTFDFCRRPIKEEPANHLSNIPTDELFNELKNRLK